MILLSTAFFPYHSLSHSSVSITWVRVTDSLILLFFLVDLKIKRGSLFPLWVHPSNYPWRSALSNGQGRPCENWEFNRSSGVSEDHDTLFSYFLSFHPINSEPTLFKSHCRILAYTFNTQFCYCGRARIWKSGP